MTDEEIERAVADDPDAAPLDIDWSKATLARVVPKTPVSIRIDPDILAFFKSKGRGYQTRINAGDHRYRIIAILPDLLQEERCKAILRAQLRIRAFEHRNAWVTYRCERNGVLRDVRLVQFLEAAHHRASPDPELHEPSDRLGDTFDPLHDPW